MTSPEREPEGAASDSIAAVVVDLDGTLISGDLLWEAVRLMLRDRPAELAGAPLWLLRGKAGFKAEMAARVRPDAQSLVYRPEVLEHVRAARAAGQRVVLASASPVPWVEAVAEHVGLFDSVLATDGATNLSGAAKLAALERHLDGAPFEYLGDSHKDAPVWRGAARATAVAPTAAARRALARIPGHRELPVEQPPLARAILKALRPHQWAKNALIFAPLLLAHELADAGRLLAVVVAFLGFCAAASAGYVVNDLVDAEADRVHPTKCRRPIASGALPIQAAFGVLAGLLLFAFGASFAFLSFASTVMLTAYLVLTLSYSLYFKSQLLVDVLFLAGLYTHRVLAGGVAADVPVSPWLLAFSTFFFLSLALVKRYIELLDMADQDADAQLQRRAYQVGDLGLVESMGLACAYISVLILCLFVSSDGVSRLYRTPELLWLMCPVMLYWISRIWFLAHRSELHDDPVLFATTDRNSWVCGALVVAVVVAAAW